MNFLNFNPADIDEIERRGTLTFRVTTWQSGETFTDLRQGSGKAFLDSIAQIYANAKKAIIEIDVGIFCDDFRLVTKAVFDLMVAHYEDVYGDSLQPELIYLDKIPDDETDEIESEPFAKTIWGEIAGLITFDGIPIRTFSGSPIFPFS